MSAEAWDPREFTPSRVARKPRAPVSKPEVDVHAEPSPRHTARLCYKLSQEFLINAKWRFVCPNIMQKDIVLQKYFRQNIDYHIDFDDRRCTILRGRFRFRSRAADSSQPENLGSVEADWRTITTATTMNTDKSDIQISLFQMMTSYRMAINGKLEKLNSLITRAQSIAAATTQHCSHSPVEEKLAELPNVMKDIITELKNTASVHSKLDVYDPVGQPLQAAIDKVVPQSPRSPDFLHVEAQIHHT
ncbi:hypothetical protein NDU88_002812 [Pleurodeles waltl]|uniref:Uncharacterized protein n=1 Tax=Pleurodeles waltl TaxID=8319 RepID=A0AAV7KTV5_PLEWA|nr:hypothetical protein NDU88_002812 [Pleurodeles waltl]